MCYHVCVCAIVCVCATPILLPLSHTALGSQAYVAMPGFITGAGNLNSDLQAHSEHSCTLSHFHDPSNKLSSTTDELISVCFKILIRTVVWFPGITLVCHGGLEAETVLYRKDKFDLREGFISFGLLRAASRQPS